MHRWRRVVSIILLLIVTGPALVGITGAVSLTSDWRTARRDSAGLAPDPESTPEAVIQVYAARAFNWRGLFAVHTWIALKPKNARQYTVHQVLGWNEWRGLPVVDSRFEVPDRYWYGAPPTVVRELRGLPAEALIEQCLSAIRDYPSPYDYTLWPGPNSNTFVAFVARQVPGLQLNLPVTAIGKDYLGAGRIFGRAPSGTGFQFSLGGVVGILLAAREGLEVNLGGAVLGIDFLRPAVKLPGIGRLGLPPAK